MGIGVDLGFDELVIEVIALAGALADAGEDRIAAMGLRDIVDQLLDQHSLADAGPAEQADLAALGIRGKQVDDLYAGDENLRFRRLLDIGGRRLMDGAQRFAFDRAGLVDRLADDVHDPPKRRFADRHGDGLTGVGDFLAADQAFRNIHRDAAHRAFAQMLGDFEHKTVTVVDRLKRVENLRQMSVELHVDDGTDHLGDAS